MAAVLSESVLDQNGPNDHFGQNDIVPNRILAFARPRWSILVHLGPPTVLGHLNKDLAERCGLPQSPCFTGSASNCSENYLVLFVRFFGPMAHGPCNFSNCIVAALLLTLHGGKGPASLHTWAEVCFPDVAANVAATVAHTRLEGAQR